MFRDFLIYRRIVYFITLTVSVIAGNLFLGTKVGINSFTLILIIYFYYYLTDFLEDRRGGADLWIISSGVHLLLFFLLWSFSKSPLLIYKFTGLWVWGNLLRSLIFKDNESREQLMFWGLEPKYREIKERGKNKVVHIREGGAFSVEKQMEELKNSHLIIDDYISQRYRKDILSLKLKGRKVSLYWQYLEEREKKIDVRNLKEEWFLETQGFTILHDTFQKKLKRLMDIVLSAVLLFLSWPIMIISAVIIKATSRGVVFYSQERIGKNGEPFKLLKFRSMKMDAESNGAVWSREKDSRVTGYGKFMRKTRVDELPQIWNILKGDMSFVGPRPERPVFVKNLVDEVPFYNLRHSIKPGLTGWAQVMYPYGSSVEDALHKLEYDLYYIKHQGIIMDILIIFKTIKTVAWGRGR